MANQSHVTVTQIGLTLFVSRPMGDMSPRALGMGQFGYGTHRVAYWLSTPYEGAQAESSRFVIQPMEPESSLDHSTKPSVFGILPMEIYYPRWRDIQTLSTPLLALVMIPLLSLETMGELSESGMQKSNSSP